MPLLVVPSSYDIFDMAAPAVSLVTQVWCHTLKNKNKKTL